MARPSKKDGDGEEGKRSGDMQIRSTAATSERRVKGLRV